MKTIKLLQLGLAATALALTACESLEDTYKEYAGDGEIRYIGRCTEVTAKPGWEHINLSWKNSIDPIIENIKVRWAYDEVADSVILPAGTTEYDLRDLENENYEITVCAIGNNGNLSIPSTVYARPYTEEHEAVASFTRVISQPYFFRNHLILTFLGWESNVETAVMTYTKANGEQGKFELTPEIVNQKYFLFPEEIDPSKPFFLERTGYIEGCPDRVVFSPAEFDNTRLYSSEFKTALKRQYGFDDEIPTAFADTVRTIYMDYDFTNMLDLFNLPKIERVVLGQHRYIVEECVADSIAKNTCNEPEATDFAFHTLSKLCNLKVERYNNHYGNIAAGEYLVDKGFSPLPEMKMMDLKGTVVTTTPKDEAGFPSYMDRLIDGDKTSNWLPMQTTTSVEYTIELDLKEVKHINGVVLTNAYYTPDQREREGKTVPTVWKIYTSEDLVTWEIAPNIEETNVGGSVGETTVINFAPGGKKARYVQLKAQSPAYSMYYYKISLAEIGLY